MMEQRSLLLVPFPFFDQKGRKVRPVIVLSNDDFNENSGDILVAGVTSNVSKSKYASSLTNKDLEDGKLSASCRIKCENILRIDKERVIRKIGKIRREKFEEVKKILFEIIK